MRCLLTFAAVVGFGFEQAMATVMEIGIDGFSEDATTVTFDEVSPGPVDSSTFADKGVAFSIIPGRDTNDSNVFVGTGNFLAERTHNRGLYVLPEGASLGEGIIRADFPSPVGEVGSFLVESRDAVLMKLYDSNDLLLYEARAEDSFVGVMSSRNNISYVTFEFNALPGSVESGGYGINDFIFSRVVPEPTSLVLLFMGASGIIALHRRR